MQSDVFLRGAVTLHAGDCLEILATLEPNSIDAVVTDPPYHFASIVERYGAPDAAPAKADGPTGVYKRASAGFMGKQWDGGDIAFDPATWAAVLRVLKPGGHLVAFGAPKNYHRLAVAIEDAGFELRDQLQWMFATGFPKSHDVSKAIDRSLGAKREKVRDYQPRNPKAIENGHGIDGGDRPWMKAARERGYHEIDSDVPATPEAAEWYGWGTALKPAYEPIALARKPLAGTIAENVRQFGTGALNIDGCRVGESGGTRSGRIQGGSVSAYGDGLNGGGVVDLGKGRWPANVTHDGSPEVGAFFPSTEEGSAAARFFFSPKADRDERLGSHHPTVKPVDLMRWLVRLVTPPGGVVLDPFAGTGSTAEAAYYEGMRSVLVERDEEYRSDIARRLGAIHNAGPMERQAMAFAKRQKPVEGTPLFGHKGDDDDGATSGTDSA